MYLRRLTVQNVKSLRDFTLDFDRDGDIRKWTVLIGENGVCKTTLLQCIALAASGPDRANQLADVPSFVDARNPEEPATIIAEFTFGAHEHHRREYPGLSSRPAKPPILRSTIRIEPGWRVFQGSSTWVDPCGEPGRDPLREASARGLHSWFVAGYGVARELPRLPPERAIDPVLLRLDSLFGKSGLIATSFRKLLPGQRAPMYAIMVTAVLASKGILPADNKPLSLTMTLDVDEHTSPKLEDIRLEQFRYEHVLDIGGERKDAPIPESQLSQGYRSIVAWISDVLGQFAWEAESPIGARLLKENTLEELHALEGLVLVDDIDLYLHPRWQLTLIEGIRTLFPNVQFIATTHSPMTIASLRADEIVRLQRDAAGNVERREVIQPPLTMTTSEIYERYFALEKLYPVELGEALQRYGLLAGDPTRSSEDDAEMKRIRQRLRDAGLDPGWEPVPRETAV